MTDNPKTISIKEKYKSETGIQWKTEGILMIDSVATYTGLFDVFATFQPINTWSIKFQNELQYFIWRFFGIFIKFDFVYDEKQKKGLQIKQHVKFGVGVVF